MFLLVRGICENTFYQGISVGTNTMCIYQHRNEKLPSNAQNTSHPPSAVDKNTHEANDRHNHASAIVISVFVVLAVFLALGLLFRKAERRQALVTSAKRIACAPCRSGVETLSFSNTHKGTKFLIFMELWLLYFRRNA